ncbi:hypothetical protein KDW_61680 [Dictyobacter vulcani]|uniref:Cytochrome b/b6 C-terminal region profile domain-containing protein n=1 Tax=Dictyobacter vulcani TaxID=2607529 RepID=A0A5J4L3E8_9CHLR|nr:hypothetical protein [Dictyobacter vulcani]GER92006.1 hypothetical protein KDW_61680 [Dictyobacter vulcani]
MSIEQKEPKVQTQAGATQRRYRTLAVVKQEAITRVEKPLEDSVFVWPHLLVREFFAATALTVMVTLLSLVIDAPLQEPATPNSTPNPAKAPWYFLGLQELLHYFHRRAPVCWFQVLRWQPLPYFPMWIVILAVLMRIVKLPL